MLGRGALPVALLAGCALALAACGDGATTTVTATVTETAPATAEATTTSTTSEETTTSDATIPDEVASCRDLDFNVTDVSVRNLTCADALRLLRQQLGQVSRSFSLGSFQCTRIEGGRLAGVWRCTDGERAIRFSFGD